jgi:hypothetical protein
LMQKICRWRRSGNREAQSAFWHGSCGVVC